MDQPIPSEQLDAISQALFQGRKIEAIKAYRDATGVGLKEAKEGVEHLESELRAKFPERFTAAPRSGGCLGLVVFGIGLALATASLLTPWA